jgi:hypothetical protein
MGIRGPHRRSPVAAAIVALACTAAFVGVGPAGADRGTPDCVAQFVGDLHADGSITVGQLLGQPPDGLAHVLHPLGSALRIQATAAHDEPCPFTYP